MIMPRSRLIVLLALAAACAPDVPQTPAPSAVTTAVFDPIAGNVPLPNDLARLPRPAGSPPFPAAQQELIDLFNSQGGFPSDQELPVTITLVRTVLTADGGTTNQAPTLDPTTVVNGATLVVYRMTPSPPGLVAIDPMTDANYVSAGDHGVLSIHNKNRAPWAAGQYVVGLRGGPNGVKTKEGDPIYAATTFFLIAQGQNLETEQNLPLLRAQTGSEAAARADDWGCARAPESTLALNVKARGAKGDGATDDTAAIQAVKLLMRWNPLDYIRCWRKRVSAALNSSGRSRLDR